jgi:hypothetical protein
MPSSCPLTEGVLAILKRDQRGCERSLAGVVRTHEKAYVRKPWDAEAVSGKPDYQRASRFGMDCTA